MKITIKNNNHIFYHIKNPLWVKAGEEFMIIRSSYILWFLFIFLII